MSRNTSMKTVSIISLKYTSRKKSLLRVLLTMKPLEKYSINFEYHSKIQGFVYSLLRNSAFEQLHDKKGYKFFCFSNIFKSANSANNHLIISSPDPRFINHIQRQLSKIIDHQIPVWIGSLFEIIKSVEVSKRNRTFPLKVVTQSPIIIRIPVTKYYGKAIRTAPYKSIMWRSEHPVDLFIDALEANMKKKYAEFSGSHISGRIFERYDFKKQVSTKINQASSKIPVIGSLWEIEFSSYIHARIQNFAIDCGLGERNSLGFGFVNPVTKAPQKNI